MVRAQMLSELEEIIAYKQFADQPERQQTIRKTWVKRFAYSSYILLHKLKSTQATGLSARRRGLAEDSAGTHAGSKPRR
jgi:FAT domain